ncbi:ParB/Srx family N-terminal domain-containing protein [Ruficoccus sp. ZRK36]|uniref:ParB/Srx family N-terminal domain-containing protein n=1 Tax=Ruficoccus sp. ZRK36 TaxID=2866311 RepID=UPI001C73761F|nr:ParB/Srx family N-terminal domain-containing protein [Ruficoccus sp. ZRK36]QYY34591.1 ParB/Srx family N-terminal domain-containing protein [Ruficoccus sp. ZRK36]
MSKAATPKAKGLADGIEVWCSFDKLVPIEDLKPNPRNPNTHPARQVELLAKNVRYFGWRHPITVSNRSGFIVAGHGRLEAARELGVQLVPVDYQDFASDNDEMAVLVADNRLAELASLDLNSLEGIIDELRVADFDTLLTGFDETDLASLLQGDDAAPGDDDDDDELDKGDVTIVLGLYRFKLTQEDYLAWIDRVKQDVGFDKQAVTKELRRRLGV